MPLYPGGRGGVDQDVKVGEELRIPYSVSSHVWLKE
jgi:hypothetical protein